MPIAFPHGDDGTLTITLYAVLLPLIQIGTIQNDDEADSNEHYYTVANFKWRNLGSRERYMDFSHVFGNLDAFPPSAASATVRREDVPNNDSESGSTTLNSWYRKVSKGLS